MLDIQEPHVARNLISAWTEERVPVHREFRMRNFQEPRVGRDLHQLVDSARTMCWRTSKTRSSIKSWPVKGGGGTLSSLGGFRSLMSWRSMPAWMAPLSMPCWNSSSVSLVSW